MTPNIPLILLDFIFALPITLIRFTIIYFFGAKYNIPTMEFLDKIFTSNKPAIEIIDQIQKPKKKEKEKEKQKLKKKEKKKERSTTSKTVTIHSLFEKYEKEFQKEKQEDQDISFFE